MKMEAWKECKLGDICKTNINSYSEKDNWTFVNYLDTGNITENKISDIQFIDLSSESLPSRARRKVQINDIIYSTVRPNQKHFGIIKKQPENFLVSTGFAVLHINKTIADPNFVFYNLIKNENTESLHAIAEQTTSAYPAIIENLSIKLPPLPTQQKIAAILSSLDDKIELNNKINTNLEQQAQALFKNWFVDFEPFGGKMPEGWKIGKLGDFVDIKRGGSPRPIQKFLSDEGYRWLKISDVTSLSAPFVLNIAEHIKEEGLSKTVFLKAGSLVLSNSATPGIPKILDLDTCIHDGWLYFPKSQLSNEYLYLLFKEIRPQLLNLGNGSIFTNLKTDILKNFEISLPSTETLSKFQNIIKPIFEKELATQREIKQLETLRNTLLPKLMNGEIETNSNIISKE